MPPRDDLTALLDRVVEHRTRPADIARLRRVTRARGDGSTVQVGGYNVNLRSGRNVHIGDRLYRGTAAETIRDLLRAIAFDGSHRGGASSHDVAGFIKTTGLFVALAGMALFFWGLVTALQAPPGSTQVPPAVVQGFGLAFAGAVISVVGEFMRGWRRPHRG